MTNQQEQITPSPEIVDQLFMIEGSEEDRIIAAYKAGADQELEACVKWIEDCGYHPSVSKDFRDARRPKPPSLKEEARQIIDCLIEGDCLNDDDAVTLRRVLEALPND
jgi:hypothetical protein